MYPTVAWKRAPYFFALEEQNLPTIWNESRPVSISYSVSKDRWAAMLLKASAFEFFNS
jgi:hypothetical protein